MNALLWAKLRADRRAMLGLGAIALMVALAILAPLVTRWDPTAIALANQLLLEQELRVAIAEAVVFV